MSPTNAIGHRFIELLTVDSTNNYAMGLVHAGMAQHGAAVFAHEQTKGKGQRSKQWISSANENLILSVVVNPKLPTSRQFLLSMCVAIASQKLVAGYAKENTKIKWPNDLYWCDRKAGGILIENIVQGAEWKWAIVGIGLNINQTSFGKLSNAVSLKQITGKEFHTVALAKELLVLLDEWFSQLINNPERIVQEYQHHLYKQNESVRLKKGNRVFETIIRGVDENGLLVTESGLEEKFGVGEVEWVIK